MGYLEEFGFKVFKLRDAKNDGEFLIYNIEKNSYATYSEIRALKYLLLEFKTKNINLVEFAIEELGIDPKNAKPARLIIYWVEEEIQLIDNIGFRPINDILFENNDKLYFNTFKMPSLMISNNYKLDKPMTYEEFKKLAPNHHHLLYNLHNKDEKAIKNTLMKIADKIKYPDLKAQDCIIIYPGEGSGKGIFYKYILQPIFGKYAKKVLMKKLNSDFNGFIREPLILVLEEGKRDLELIETLKEVITEGSLLINEKGKPQTEEDIYFLTFVFSNHMNPIDLGKRRGSYHLAHSLGKNVDESQTIGAGLCDKLPAETHILLKYLHNLEFDHQDAMRPFKTKAKGQVNDLNKSIMELFYDYIITYDSFDKSVIDLSERRFGHGSLSLSYEFYKRKGGKEEEIYIAKDIFKDAYNNFCHLEGLKSNIIRHNKDIVQLWALFKIPEDSHQRIIVKNGENAGRKIDHIRLKDIQDHIKEVIENEEE